MKILSADFGGAEPALAICSQCTCGAKVAQSLRWQFACNNQKKLLIH